MLQAARRRRVSPAPRRCPCAASVTSAVRSSRTATHRLMPSSPVVCTPRPCERRHHRGSPARVGGARRGHRGAGRVVAEQLHQHRLQQPARPPRSEQPALGQAGHHLAGPADGGQPEVGTVRLGVAADVDGPARQVRAEAHVGGLRDVAGVVVLDDPDARRPQQPSQLGRAPGAHRHPGRVVGPRLEEQGDGLAPERRLQRTRDDTLLVERQADRFDAELVEEVEQRREGRVLHQHPVAQPQQQGGDAVHGVHGPVDHRQALGREGPGGAQHLVERRDHRIVEVARGHHLRSDPGQERAEVGEQLRVGGPRGEVEPEVPGPLGHPPVARRATRALAVEHEGPEPPPALDGADAGEGLPGLADGRRARAEAPSEVADRRQAGAGGQVARGDQAADAGRDAAGAAVLDGPDQIVQRLVLQRPSFSEAPVNELPSCGRVGAVLLASVRRCPRSSAAGNVR